MELFRLRLFLRSLRNRYLSFGPKIPTLCSRIVSISSGVHKRFFFLFLFLFVGHGALLRWVVFIAISLGSLPEVPTECKGWECDVVYCPDGYAVQLPSGEFLPCADFDQYVNGDESVAIGHKNKEVL